MLRPALLILLSWSTLAMAIETPRYTVVERGPDLELRDYAPYLVAEVVVEGTQSSAGNRAFQLLAGYIFGNNTTRAKVAMTAPVTQQAKGETIAMTAPVTQEARGPSEFTVQFMMPSSYTLETLPVPSDDRVVLREVPARRFAAIRYSGTWSEKNYRHHLEKLEAAMARAGLDPVGAPVWARYDAPYMPWFLRTNEILIQVAAPPRGS